MPNGSSCVRAWPVNGFVGGTRPRASQHLGVKRRTLLRGLGCAAVAACAPRWPAQPQELRAIAFDLFTLFDPRTVERRVATVITDDPAGFGAAWKTRLFEHCWLRATAGAYVAFDRLVEDALTMTARARKVRLAAPARDHLASVFTELDPWPDAHEALCALRDRGLRLAPLANFSPPMIRALLASAKFDALFDLQISTDEARTYKPDPRAYALAEHRFGLPRTSIAFAAFGGWDAWGASTFGLRTFWVDRLDGVDVLDASVASGPDLTHLLGWLS
jgi:2-haloacid dehalogenase